MSQALYIIPTPPATLQDLKHAIGVFSRANNVTEDIFYDLLFATLKIDLTYKLQDVALNIEMPGSRPFLCAIRESTTPGFCKFNFLETMRDDNWFSQLDYNYAYKSMVLLFLQFINVPNFDITDDVQWSAFDQIIDDLEEDDLGYEVDLPIQNLIDLLESEHAQTALQSINSDQFMSRAYNANIPDIPLNTTGLPFVGVISHLLPGQPLPTQISTADLALSFTLCMGRFQHMKRTLNDIVEYYYLNIENSDIFETSLALMFGAEETPDGANFSIFGTTYASLKRDFLIELDMPMHNVTKMVDNINQELPDSAAVVQQALPGIRLSFLFIQQVFLPRFTNFLQMHPWLIVSMREQYKARIMPSDPFYEYYFPTQSVELVDASGAAHGRLSPRPG